LAGITFVGKGVGLMKCPHCGFRMELNEYYNYYVNDTTLTIDEYWWCPNCDATPSRMITITQSEERWED
jgi:rubredoxin